MKGYHRHVPKQVGKNPIAQAVAKNALSKAITDQKIALYLLADGEACGDVLAGVAGVLQVAHLAGLEERKTGPEMGVVKGGLNACLQVMLADRYDTTQTVAIATGLDKALLLAKKLKPESINKAWHAYVKGTGK